MRAKRRGANFLVAMVFLALGTVLFSARLAGQEEGWQIVRAEYGFRAVHTDVTDLLKDLIERGGVNGRVAVNNQTMGGDPAPGKDKVLRIFARNRRREEREFTYNEGGFVEARMFIVKGDDWDDRPANYGRDQDDWNGLRIVRAYYGVQGRTVNVTDLLRSRVRDGMLSLVVTNSAMGGDPAPGADKVLIVVYRSDGKEQATAVREGYTLTIP